MKEKRNLYYLVDVISAQSQLDPKVVKSFITQFFREIEKGLVNSSFVKIDNLGIFRIIKSLSSDRILFLPKFNTIEEPLNNTEQNSNELVDLADRDVEPKISVDDFFNYAKDGEQEDNPVIEIEEEIVAVYSSGEETTINDQVNIHDDNTQFTEVMATESSDSYSDTESDIDSEITSAFDDENKLRSNLDGDFRGLEEQEDEELYYYDYAKQTKKETSTVKLALLFTLAILIISAALYFLFVHPTENKNRYHNFTSNAYQPVYVEMDNADTVNYCNVIRAESNIDFLSLSKIYYNYEIFWPYIYLANETEVGGPFEIKSGTVIKIPNLDKDLIDINNQDSVEKAKYMANEIILTRDKVMKDSIPSSSMRYDSGREVLE